MDEPETCAIRENLSTEQRVKGRRVTYPQLESMWNILKSNKALATGFNKSSQAREQTKRMWASLARILNSHGDGAHKEGKEWSKYWNDYKSKLKARLTELRASSTGTGGGPSKVKPLTEIEKKFVQILGSNYGSGLAGARVEPFNQPQTEALQTDPLTYNSSAPLNVHYTQLHNTHNSLRHRNIPHTATSQARPLSPLLPARKKQHRSHPHHYQPTPPSPPKRRKLPANRHQPPPPDYHYVSPLPHHQHSPSPHHPHSPPPHHRQQQPRYGRQQSPIYHYYQSPPPYHQQQATPPSPPFHYQQSISPPPIAPLTPSPPLTPPTIDPAERMDAIGHHRRTQPQPPRTPPLPPRSPRQRRRREAPITQDRARRHLIDISERRLKNQEEHLELMRCLVTELREIKNILRLRHDAIPRDDE